MSAAISTTSDAYLADALSDSAVAGMSAVGRSLTWSVAALLESASGIVIPRRIESATLVSTSIAGHGLPFVIEPSADSMKENSDS